MRRRLLDSFDKIYILNLHGNSWQKETAEDGTPDENVFDIRQGVSICIFIKTGTKRTKDEVFYRDLFGTRESK
jgi:predicted helicase